MQHYSESWLGPKRRSLYFNNSSIKIPRISSDTKMILTALKKKGGKVKNIDVTTILIKA